MVYLLVILLLSVSALFLGYYVGRVATEAVPVITITNTISTTVVLTSTTTSNQTTTMTRTSTVTTTTISPAISNGDFSTTLDGVYLNMSAHTIGTGKDARLVVDVLLQNNGTKAVLYPVQGCYLFGFEIRIVTPNGTRYAAPSIDGNVVTYTCLPGIFIDQIPPGGRAVRQGLFYLENIPCYASGQGFSSTCRLEAEFTPLPPAKPITIHYS